jgi:hypothetical protein
MVQHCSTSDQSAALNAAIQAYWQRGALPLPQYLPDEPNRKPFPPLNSSCPSPPFPSFPTLRLLYSSPNKTSPNSTVPTKQHSSLPLSPPHHQPRPRPPSTPAPALAPTPPASWNPTRTCPTMADAPRRQCTSTSATWIPRCSRPRRSG